MPSPTPLNTNIQLKTYRSYLRTNSVQAHATIYIYDLAEQWVGVIRCIGTGTGYTLNTFGIATLQFPFANYGDIMSLLRDELPMYLRVNSDGSAELNTSVEPIGESEL